MNAAPGPDPTVQLCVFQVGGREYALDIMRIEEILPVQQVTPVPRAPPFVEGVINLRGAILPVIDLRLRLGTNPSARTKPKLLVCFLGRRRLALRVEGVTQVIRLLRSDLKPVPSLVAPGAVPYLVGVFGPPERLRLLLNLKAVLQPEPGASESADG